MDRIIRATAGDGAIKMAVINARDTVERARQIHGCAPTACAALGRTLCAASLMGQDMKEENAALTIRINGGGPLGGIVAVSDCDGNVRGYVGNPATELPLRSSGSMWLLKPDTGVTPEDLLQSEDAVGFLLANGSWSQTQQAEASASPR